MIFLPRTFTSLIDAYAERTQAHVVGLVFRCDPNQPQMRAVLRHFYTGVIMGNSSIPFQTIDWKNVPRTEHKGETGIAYWQAMQFDGLRVRYVEYSKNYKADHWCKKGHIVYCLEGEVINELQNGTKSTLRKGMSYIVSDDLSSHRSVTENGVHLLIIDGDFLK